MAAMVKRLEQRGLVRRERSSEDERALELRLTEAGRLLLGHANRLFAIEAEAQRALLPHLPADHFPGGAKAGWWMKAAQLDLEAKGVIARAPKPPVRLFRVVGG